MSTAGKRLIRRIGVGISVTINVVIVAGAIWLSSGGIEAVAQDYIVKPTYDRWVSQFEQLPVQAGDNDELHLFGEGYLAWRDIIQRHVNNHAPSKGNSAEAGHAAR